MTARQAAHRLGDYSAQYRHFSPPIGRFMAANLAGMLGFQIATLFLNFYLQALGQDAAFIGLYNALPGLMTVLLGLPVGLLSDQLGPRRAILLGMAVQTLGLLITVAGDSAALLIAGVCIQGVGNAFTWASNGPFMMSHTRPDQRSSVFSLQGALANGTGFLGNLLGGYIPLGLALALGVSSTSLMAVRGALWVAVVLSALAILPLLGVADRATAPADPGAALAPTTPTTRRRLFSNPGLVARLLLPGTLVGLGAGMNIPVLNVFVQQRFGINFNELGFVFALAAIGTMIATLMQPWLAGRVGRVRSTLVVQALSLPFLVILGFVPVFPLVVLALVLRGALMNMSNPIFSAFSMEQIPAGERARFSSVTAMLWSAGWAAGSSFAGWWRGLVGFDAGFNTTFALMTACYAASFVLVWWWFDRPEAAARRTALPATEVAAS